MNLVLDNVVSLAEWREQRDRDHQYEQAVAAQHPSSFDPGDGAA